ncbi:MAG TPA: phage holin family protein [Ferruginibacter sp.]|nr:phage holin family protein [Ferruginibacter sp.]HRO16806.1 phage holin family protein [Ferruginibacter sp.]HRQ20089.1 phage holin family protein [Ferruginibacter sp.]
MNQQQKEQTIDAPKEELNELFDHLTAYVEATVELNKMKAASKAASIGSTLIHKSIGVIMLSMVFLLLSVGAAFLVGEWLGKVYYGFFAMGGLYLIIAIIFLRSNKKMESKLTDTLIKEMFK